MQAIHWQKLEKKEMINWNPWSNPPDDFMRAKLHHVHHYEWKYRVMLLEFQKKSDLSHSLINIDTYYTLCCTKDLAYLALFQRTVGLGHISMLWRILLVHFQRLPQWGSSIRRSISSLGDTFRVSLVCITCIPQRFTVFWNALFTFPHLFEKRCLYCVLAVPSSLTLTVNSLSHAPPWEYLDLSAHIVSLQQTTISSLLLFAGSFSLMGSCYETLLQGRCSW